MIDINCKVADNAIKIKNKLMFNNIFCALSFQCLQNIFLQKEKPETYLQSFELYQHLFNFYQITTRFSGSSHIPSSGLTSNAL